MPQGFLNLDLNHLFINKLVIWVSWWVEWRSVECTDNTIANAVLANAVLLAKEV